MCKFNRLLLVFFSFFMICNAFSAPVTQANIATARNAGTLQESWISGSSAATYNIFIGFSTRCDANTLAVFNSNQSSVATRPGSFESGNFLAYACIRGGKVSVIYHTMDGGSFNAYAPHIPNDLDGDGVFGTTNLRRIGKLGWNYACVAQTGTLSLPNQAAIPSYSACSIVTPATSPDGATVKPAGGFSDVEAAMFSISTDGFGIESDVFIGQVLGVATSVPLYRAMQVAQGIYASELAANTADPNFLPVNSPSISRAQYTSLITGSTQSWKYLVPDSTKRVNLIKYLPTSGLQASSNIFFLHNPCNENPNIAGMLMPVRVYDSTISFNIQEVSSSNLLKKALTSNSEFAIGVLSLENDWRVENSSSPANGYRFVKLDGVHPEAARAGSGQTVDANARYSAAQGLYDFYMEMKSFVVNSAAGTFGETVINEIGSAFIGLDCADVPRGVALNPFSGSTCSREPQFINGKVIESAVSKASRAYRNCQVELIY